MLRDHCGHARYVWNLAVEQHSHRRLGRASAPGYLEQCRQLTAARAEFSWLAAGSQMVQQQALRDFAQAMAAFFSSANPAGRPSWRKARRDEGFRIVGRRGRQRDVRRVSRRVGQIWVPKAGWVRFRWSRAVPPGVKSYRVTRDRAGRWHVAFAAIPDLARLRARETDRRKDWAERTSTDLARRFDIIRVENLDVMSMTRSARGIADAPGRNVRAKAGLNRGILRSGWGLLVRRLEDKAPGRVEKVTPHFTSQRRPGRPPGAAEHPGPQDA